MKGYKVTDSNRRRKIGVACSSLLDLEKKGMKKLDLLEKCVIALEDGTIVQDAEYFATLPAQTLFVFYKLHEPIITGVDVVLSALNTINSDILNVAPEVAKMMRFKTHELGMLLNNTFKHNTGNTALTDPGWFDGLDTNAATKEDFMFRKAQDRIRGYLYKFQEDVKKSIHFKEPTKRRVLTDVLQEFKKRLDMDRFFGSYFDRRYAAPTDQTDSGSKKKLKLFDVPVVDHQWSYCDAGGVFVCQGLWNLNSCTYQHHLINPYSNRESRVVFSTWNLDHKIEKSRTILPALLTAVEAVDGGKHINIDYFYSLLFTKVNLKLVHIVCHDKTSHDIPCNNGFFYLPNS